MATVILLRHGRTTANASGVLAGRLPGVGLDDVGVDQAAAAAQRISAVPVAAVVSSPLERCRETAGHVLRAQAGRGLRLRTAQGISECDYGSWQGRPLKELAKEPLWRVVQTQPSAAAFPEGESLHAMQARAVRAVRRLDTDIEEQHGADAVWVAVSHGDIIKSVLADALGMHLDLFQRLHVDPASVSVIRYTDTRPYVLATNTRAGDLGWLAPPTKPKRRGRRDDDAVVGGGAGHP